MKSYLKKYLVIFGSVGCYLLLMKAAVYSKHSPRRDISPLESSVAQIHLGSNTTEVDTLRVIIPTVLIRFSNAWVCSDFSTLIFATTKITKDTKLILSGS